MPQDLDRSAPQLVGDLITQVTELIRKELLLLRTEMSEKATQAAVACGMIIASVVAAIVALNVLAAALVVALTNIGFAPGWASLVVGVVLACVALFLAGRGAENLKASQLAPNKTVRAASRDASMIKEKV